MWPRAWALFMGVLAAWLILTRRRLSRVQAELDHARAESGARSGRDAEGGPARAETVHAQTAAPSAERAPETTTGSDLASEWEQAVPPMDS